MTEVSEIILKHGYLPESIPASMDLFEEIEKLKKRKKCRYSGALLSGVRHTGCGRFCW